VLGILRVFRKDLFELLDGFRGIVLVFVLPSLLILLVGQLQTRTDPLELLVAGRSTEGPAFDRFMDLLNEISLLRITTRPEPVVDPLRVLQDERLDLVLNIEGESRDQWRFYTAETHRVRLVSLRQLVAGLDRALRLDEYEEDLLTELFVVGTLRPGRLTSYFPSASDRGPDLVARTLALILCFLPFVLAAPSWIREKQAHTLEVVLAAPSIGPTTVVVGKSLYAVLVTLFDFLLLLVLAQSVYFMQIKAGLAFMVVFLLPALLGSALLGLAISAIAKSHAQTMIVSALYFFGMTLLSGFLYPLGEASTVVRWLAHGFSLTFVQPVLKAWMSGVQPVPVISGTAAALWAQCALFAGLAALAVRHALRRI
jgi:ABC-type multidrug transport system permease subunit